MFDFDLGFAKHRVEHWEVNRQGGIAESMPLGKASKALKMKDVGFQSLGILFKGS